MNHLRRRRALVEQLLKSPRYEKARNAVAVYQNALEPEDAVGEFHVGIAEALHSVKMDIGDPMEYLISCGFRRMQSAMSMMLTRTVFEECMVCGLERPYRRNPCSRCGEKNFLIHPRMKGLHLTDDGSSGWETNNRRTKPWRDKGQRPQED